MSEEKTKAMEKIKKCLALGKSSNEHEAAAALRQAQKLMEKFQVSEEDLEGVDYVITTVITDYEYGQKKPLIVVAVANLIQHALGMSVVMTIARNGRGAPMHAVGYAGPRHRAHIAQYAHTVVYRAVGKAWRKYADENPHVKSVQGARAGFYAGWCATAASKVEALVINDTEKAGTQKAIARHFGETGKAKVNTKVKGDTMNAGADAGRDFELNKPINQDRMRLT